MTSDSQLVYKEVLCAATKTLSKLVPINVSVSVTDSLSGLAGFTLVSVSSRYMVYGFSGYAFLNFALFLGSGGSSGPGNTGLNPPANVWRGFSGHWMVFYSAALAILYSAVNEGSGALRCVNGHRVSRGAVYCTICGQPVLHAITRLEQ
jgi:hypothetical protein